jgi:hypothetical protein
LDNFDLIGALRTYATSLGWRFIYGDNFFKNYEASKLSLTVGTLILGADPFIARPKFTKAGKIESITYQGLIMLGRKYEASTKANLDETMIQKYDRRLKELMGTLSTNLLTFACNNKLEITSAQFELSINSLDETVDFVIASVTILQEI